LDASAKKLPIKGEIAEIAKQFGIKDVREVLALRMILLAFSKSPSASLSAIKEAIDRVEGQSKQNIVVTQNQVSDATELTEQQLQAIYEGRADFTTIARSTESVSGTAVATEKESEEA
jgi:hypothetical protein